MIDHDAAKRAVFLAQEDDEKNRVAWDKRRPETLVPALAEAFEIARQLHGPFLPKVAPVRSMLSGLAENDATISDAGHVYRIAESDDDAPETAFVMQTASGRFMARVESVLQSICRDETGQFETEQETKTRLEKEARLLRQGHAVCAGLEAAGVKGYRADVWKLMAFDIHSHEVTEIPAFRRICLNPYVAHRLRLPFLNWLQLFAQGREKSLRFWTFTTGRRVPIHRLEARITWLHRRLSELNAAPFMVSAGVRIVFRSTEFGSLETTERKKTHAENEETGGALEGGTGGRWYHPHAHCIVWFSKGQLPKWHFRALLENVWRFWRHNWDEGSRIRDMREAVKYLVKPGQIVELAQQNPKELVRLQEVVFRKKLVQPMDELARQMKAARKAGLIPALRWKDDVRKWTLIANPNRNRLARGSEKSGFVGSDGVPADFRARGDDCQTPLPHEMTNTQAERYFSRNHRGLKAGTVDVCRVVARCAPAYNSRGVKSPRVIVCGSIFDRRAILAHPLVRRMVSATREAYARGVIEQAAERGGLALLGETGSGRPAQPPAIRVHTGTPTVFPPDPGPPDFEPAEAVDSEFLAELAGAAGLN